MQISKNNYIQPAGTGDTFTVSITAPLDKFDNYFIESCKAAEEIYSQKQGNLYILYSGGLDSEYALSIFLSMGMKVTPVIARMNTDYNSHDFKYANDFCSAKNITPIIIDINLEEFVKSGKILDIAKSIKSNIYHYSTTAHAISKLDGTIICGDCEPHVRNNENGTWSVDLYEYDYALVNYFKNNNINGTPHFNCYTPEMMFSYLNSTRIKELVEHKHPGKLGSHSSKGFVYNEHSNFNLTIRPKYHGFELVETSELFKHEIFKEFDKLPWTGVYHKEYYSFMKQCEQ